MPRTPHPIWTDAEALFLHVLAWLDVPSVADAIAGVVLSGAAWAALPGAVAALVLRAARPRRTGARRTHSPTSPRPMTRTLLVLAAFVAAPALAQTHAEAMARLAPYAGSYSLDGTAEMPLGASDEGGTFGGTLDVSPALGGHFQEWDWAMTMPTREGDGPSTVHLRFVTTYNTETGAYDVWRFDVRDVGEWARPGGMEPRGTLRFDGDALVMAWPTANPDDPSQTGTFRNTVHLRDAGIEVVTDATIDDGPETFAIATTRAARR